MSAQHVPASLAGRCANGYERDQGRLVHAVPDASIERNAYSITLAACRAKPGARSGGWSWRMGQAVTCPKCMRAMSRLSESQQVPA